MVAPLAGRRGMALYRRRNCRYGEVGETSSRWIDDHQHARDFHVLGESSMGAVYGVGGATPGFRGGGESGRDRYLSLCM